jgi:hypothetical protein
MSIPERSLALFLGVTALPLRVIYNSIQLAAAVFLLGLGAIIGIPVMLGIILNNRGHAFYTNFLFNAFIIAPIVLLTVIVGLPAAAIYLFYSTTKDILRITWAALKSGYMEGMEGFWRIWGNQTGFLDNLLLRLRVFTNRYAEEHQINRVEDFDLMSLDLTELVEVIRPTQSHDIQDLEVKIPATSNLESLFIQRGCDLMKQISIPDTLVPPLIKAKGEELKQKIERYQELSGRLEGVQKALINNNLEGIKNEVIVGIEIKTPILFFKQYNGKDNIWHAVPASSNITDKDSLLTWLKENPTHPLTRDVIKSPWTYNGMFTRYKWHTLTAEHCMAQELIEGAAEIQKLLETLSAQLDAATLNKRSPGSAPQAFFGSTSLKTESLVPIQLEPNHLVCS